MTESAAKPTPINSSASQALQVMIRGVVKRSRRYEGKTYTTIICPAADEYSYPSVVEVRSKDRVGDVDEVVTVAAKVGGFEQKPFRVVDKDTGETRMVVRVTHFLDLIE